MLTKKRDPPNQVQEKKFRNSPCLYYALVLLILVLLLVPLYYFKGGITRFSILQNNSEPVMEIQYNQIEDDPEIDSRIISSHISGNDLIIEYSSNEKPRIESLSHKNYKIENNKVTIYNFNNYDYNNERFYIEISKAEHLDENRSFISDIYREVKALDGIWSEAIPNSHYVRVTFEKNLTSDKDITLYPRIVLGEPKIEVYEVDGNEKIAEFSSLNSNQYNKVYLNQLGWQGNQDTFDLKVVSGDVEFDYVVDPWLSGWSKRIKLTTNSTMIDEDLTHFPITVFLKAGNGDTEKVFDEVGANYLKIAIADDSNPPVQYYVEVEYWNAISKVGVLHFGKAGEVLPSTTDKDFYLYYDNTRANNTDYVGETGSEAAQKVWESANVMTQHMNDNPDTSHIKDSTSYANDGLKKGSNEPIEVDGKIAKAQDYDGTDDYAQVPHNSSIDPTSAWTLEAWMKRRQINVQHSILEKYDWTPGKGNYGLRVTSNNKVSGFVTHGTTASACEGVTNLAADIWYHVVATFDASTDTLRCYVNGALDNENTNVTINPPSSSVSLKIGCRANDCGTKFNGLIDEARIYSKALSSAEIKASYHSTNDTLLTYGSEEVPETQAPTYSNDADDSSGSVVEGTIVNVSVLWQDNIGLDTAVFRSNQSGSWTNISTCTLSGTSEWCNKTIDTSGDAGKTICWNQYANDTASNWNTTMPETSHCFNVIALNHAPQIILELPANNTQFNNTQDINFNFTAIDDYNTTLSCSIYLDGVLNQTNSSTQNNTLTNFLINGISYGSHNWSISCTDGELSNASETRSFTVDMTPPNVTLNFPPPAYTTNSTTLDFNFTAIDDSSSTMLCELILDGSLNQTNSSVQNNTPTIFTVADLTEGSHIWNVNCTDSADNEGPSEERSFTINVSPKILLNRIYPTTNTNITQNEFFNIMVNVTCSDADCGDINVSSYADSSLIPSGSGIPFYVNGSNPRTINLNASQSQLVTFWVNTTGEIGTTHTFFEQANLTINMSIGNSTEEYNVTIKPTTWLPGWSKRIKLTTNSTMIDEDLTHFPITVFLKAGNGDTEKVFDEVGANYLKIAIADDSNPPVQYYVEVEYWNAISKVGVLHFGKAGEVLPSTTDKDFYLYYDNTRANNTDYVGETGSEAAQKVWESANVMTQHMNDNPNAFSTKDSTSNANNGTKQAANEPIEVEGKIGKAQQFDSVNDLVNCWNDTSLDGTEDLTLEAWVYLDGTQKEWALVVERDDWKYSMSIRGGNKLSFFARPLSPRELISNSGLPLNTWAQAVITYEKSTGEVRFYINGTLDREGTMNGTIPSNDGNVYIGRDPKGGSNWAFKGIIDEVRIYNRTLSPAEIKASYHSTNDTLLTYGTEEVADTTAPEVTLNSPYNGLLTSNTNITFNCSASDLTELSNITLWLNSSGWQANETKDVSGTSNSTMFTKVFGEGIYLWSCSSCDALGHCNTSFTENRTFTIDLSTPTISYVPPTDSNNAYVSRLWTYINVSVTDSENISMCVLDWNNTNESMTMVGSGQNVSCYINKSDVEGMHSYNVYANDSAGNIGAAGQRIITFDVTAPLITNENATSITSSSATITWNTNESANSTVNYGTNTSLGTLRTNSALVTNHSISLSGLSANTLYYYNVTSCDSAGNCNTTGPHNFTTTSAPSGGGGGGGAGGARLPAVICGNGICEAGESWRTCSADCPKPEVPEARICNITIPFNEHRFSTCDQLNEKDSIYFTFENITHYIVIETITQNYVDVTVYSLPQQARIDREGAKSFDLNGDNKDDILVIVDNITEIDGKQKASMTVILLKCVCPECGAWSACIKNKQYRICYNCSEATNFTCVAVEETRECELPSANVWNIGVIILIVLLALLLIYLIYRAWPTLLPRKTAFERDLDAYLKSRRRLAADIKKEKELIIAAKHLVENLERSEKNLAQQEELAEERLKMTRKAAEERLKEIREKRETIERKLQEAEKLEKEKIMENKKDLAEFKEIRKKAKLREELIKQLKKAYNL